MNWFNLGCRDKLLGFSFLINLSRGWCSDSGSLLLSLLLFLFLRSSINLCSALLDSLNHLERVDTNLDFFAPSWGLLFLSSWNFISDNNFLDFFFFDKNQLNFRLTDILNGYCFINCICCWRIFCHINFNWNLLHLFLNGFLNFTLNLILELINF